MFILEVIPLTPLPHGAPQVLSYLSEQSLETGVVVAVPIQGRSVNAVVISSANITSRRINIKKSDFQLKKIQPAVTQSPQVSPFQLRLALWLSQTYYAPLSLCLKAVLPTFALKKNFPISSLDCSDDLIRVKPEIMVSSPQEILKNIDSKIMKALSDGKNALLIVPDQTILGHLEHTLESSYPLTTFTSGLTARRTEAAWRTALGQTPRFFLTTRAGLFLPYANLGFTAILDPDHEAYKSDQSPRYETRKVTKFLASWHGSSMVVLPPILSIGDYQATKSSPKPPVITSAHPRPSIEIIDSSPGSSERTKRLMGRQLTEDLRDEIGAGHRILFFSTRKGYLTILICQNCNAHIRCDNCSGPMRVHQLPSPSLVCHHCLAVKGYPDHCPNCKSSNLKAFGLPGTERIGENLEDFLLEYSLKAPIILLDRSLTPNPRAEQRTAQYLDRPGPSITVASQMIFSYLTNLAFDYIAIVSADGLMTLPDFRTHEQLIYTIEKLLQFQPKKILIQTFQADHPIWNQVQSGNYRSFYDSELAVRSDLGYPPFTRLVRLTFKNSSQKAALTAARTLADRFRILLSQLKIETQVKISGPSSALISQERGLYAYHLILKLEPNLKLEPILKYVPKGWIIDPDPRHLM